MGRTTDTLAITVDDEVVAEADDLFTDADDRWRDYADFLHRETVLSTRQAEVFALTRFGYDADDIVARLDGVSTENTVMKHQAAISDKTDGARLLHHAQFPTLDHAGIAPVPRLTATVEASRGEHRFTLYQNAAEGTVLTDADATPATARYFLVRETTTTRSRAQTTERHTTWYADAEEFVLAGPLTAVLPDPEDACASVLAACAAAIDTGDPQDFLDRRADLYPTVEAAYRAVARGETSATTVAETYGFPEGHVVENVAALTGVTSDE